MKQIKVPRPKKNNMMTDGQIIRVEALSNYSRIYFVDGSTLVLAKVLQWFEDFLPAEKFIRVHRSHLVNKKFVKAINGEKIKTILLNNGDNIVVSRRRRRMVALL